MWALLPVVSGNVTHTHTHTHGDSHIQNNDTDALVHKVERRVGGIEAGVATGVLYICGGGDGGQVLQLAITLPISTFTTLNYYYYYLCTGCAEYYFVFVWSC